VKQNVALSHGNIMTKEFVEKSLGADPTKIPSYRRSTGKVLARLPGREPATHRRQRDPGRPSCQAHSDRFPTSFWLDTGCIRMISRIRSRRAANTRTLRGRIALHGGGPCGSDPFSRHRSVKSLPSRLRPGKRARAAHRRRGSAMVLGHEVILETHTRWSRRSRDSCGRRRIAASAAGRGARPYRFRTAPARRLFFNLLTKFLQPRRRYFLSG